MENETLSFAVGAHRPVYLWAGPGTIRMNRLKFMDAPVDTFVHTEAHRPEGAARMVDEAGFNWIYLTYDWGFPPEVEQEDWKAFAQAAAVYHEAGARVFGYVQLSNCVFDGSYRTKDWYALDPQGRRFHYYTGRYMTCWLHPGWIEHLKEMTRGVIQAGADGVFYDNPWNGAQPLHFGGAWLGPVGCYCERCRTAFQMAAGAEIPVRLDLQDEVSRQYIRWRARQVTRVLGQLADHARTLKPDVVVSVNDFDAVMRPSYLVFGVDLAGLAQVQDVMMIEDYGLPRLTGNLLVNNALTLRTAHGLCGGTPVSTIPYDKGIGFDGVYPAERLVLGMVEAAACGAPMVVKGTEYVENKAFTLLTAKSFAPQREALGRIHKWLSDHAALYAGARSPSARLALLHPGDALWAQWDALAPLYFGVGQTLLAAGVPWRVVPSTEALEGVELLITFGAADAPEDGPRVVDVTQLPGWKLAGPSLLARSSWAQWAVSAMLQRLYRGYFRSRLVRRLGDRLGLVHFFLQSPYFRLPSRAAQETLLAALGELPYPQVTVDVPMLAEVWRTETGEQLHLVNYTETAEQVGVSFARPVKGKVIRLDGPGAEFVGLEVTVPVGLYTVLDYRLVA